MTFNSTFWKSGAKDVLENIYFKKELKESLNRKIYILKRT
jgi:hypothetical protein